MSRILNRNGWTVIAFLAVVLIGDRVGGQLINHLFQSTKFRFSQLYSGELPADLVFIGNSRGVHMFHPPPLEAASGHRVANLSFNGMPAQLMPCLWQDYLDHHETPQKLFVEVSCIGRDSNPSSMERFTVLMSESPSIAEMLAERRQRAYRFCKLSHLYRFNSELTWRSLFFLRRSDQDWIMSGEVAANWQADHPETGLGDFVRSDEDVKAIATLVKVAKESGVDVQLILAPYLPEYYRRLPPNDDWLAWLEDELGQPVVDYSGVISNRESFADPIHLNATGAELFAKFLKEQGDLSPQR